MNELQHTRAPHFPPRRRSVLILIHPNREDPSLVLRAVHLLDRARRVLLRLKPHGAVPARPPRLVHGDVRARDGPDASERRLQLLPRRRERQI
eukprot:28787-Pelagococcus_subviridis.AAC.1